MLFETKLLDIMTHVPNHNVPENHFREFNRQEEPQARYALDLQSENVVFVGTFTITEEHYCKMLHQFYSTISNHFNVLPLLVSWVYDVATTKYHATVEIW